MTQLERRLDILPEERCFDAALIRMEFVDHMQDAIINLSQPDRKRILRGCIDGTGFDIRALRSGFLNQTEPRHERARIDAEDDYS